MNLTRLFAAALVICSLPAFTQDPQSQKSRSSTLFFFFDWSHYKAATPSEPWRLISKTPAEVGGVNALDPARVDQYRPDRRRGDFALAFVSKARSTAGMPDFWLDGGDTACFKIRSYVVARDRKDSDSTHPVSYSTCQPSSRYGLKTTGLKLQTARPPGPNNSLPNYYAP